MIPRQAVPMMRTAARVLAVLLGCVAPEARAADPPRMASATGPRGLVTVYTLDPGASALLAGTCDAFRADLAAWLRHVPSRRPVTLIFHRLDDDGEEPESRVLETAIPAAVYRVRKPVPRRTVLRDLVILDVMVRRYEPQDRARAAGIPDWLTYGLAATLDKPKASGSDRLVARLIRRSGRVPSLDSVLVARADIHGAPVVESLGALLVRSIAESPAGRRGVARLLENTPSADQSALEWMAGAFPDPAPDPRYLRRWWALACVRASQRLPGSREDASELAAELHDALNPVVRTATDLAGQAFRVSVRDLPRHRHEPWFRRAVAEAGARLDRVLLLAPSDLREPLIQYREAVRRLAGGRIARFEDRYDAADKAWRAAVGRREAIADYLDRYDRRTSGAETMDLDTLLDAMREAAASGDEASPSAIRRYLDAVEAGLDPHGE